MEGNLLVTPEQLTATSSEFSSAMQQITTMTNEMMEQVHSLKGQWEGEASNAYQNKFDQLKDDIDKIGKMINEHVNDLNEMAKVYQDAENANADTANELSGDVLQ